MDSCCQKKSEDLEKLSASHSKVLWTVLVINALMFVVELVAGVLGNSVSLIGDSLDMMGDAIAYGSSIYVIKRGARAKAKSAMLKGGIIVATGLVVMGRAIYQAISQVTPQVEVMGTIGLLALVANIICLALLTKHKSDDINMASVWICSRNDIIANTSVLLGAGLVYVTGSPWPDIGIGFSLTVLFLISGIRVLREARKELSA